MSALRRLAGARVRLTAPCVLGGRAECGRAGAKATLTLLATIALPAYGAPTYQCVTEESTGFHFKDGKWRQSSFGVEKDRFILRKLKEGESWRAHEENAYGAFEADGNTLLFPCTVMQAKFFVCGSGMAKLFFSADSGHFIRSNLAGYWGGEDNNDNKPMLSRGRCSRT